MIQSASFRNFKSLRHVDVEFERLTVLVGANASGKTSILEGLYYLAELPFYKPSEFFSGVRHPIVFYSRGAAGEPMELRCLGRGTGVRLRIEPPSALRMDLRQSRPPSKTPLEPGWDFRAECKLTGDSDCDWKSLAENPSYIGEFGPAIVLRLDSTVLAAPSFIDRPDPHVDTSGVGLASSLAFMALNQPDRFQELQGHLRSIIPAFRRIRFDRLSGNRTEKEIVTIDGERMTRHVNKEYVADFLLFDFQGATDIPAHLTSEGTLLVLGLLAAVFDDAGKRLIMVEDLERGLHPKAQRELVKLLRRLLEDRTDLQVIASTHSPYVVDELDPREVRITWADDIGSTQCARLDSHPDFERWKDEMWPGEFWSLVGEQWIGNGHGQEKP
jgi:hypothetical protein